MTKAIDWFRPGRDEQSHASHQMASIFFYTHVFGPLLAQPMWLYLWFATDAPRETLLLLIAMTWSFVLLPPLWRLTGSFRLVTLLSFQLLAGTALFASLHFGGFSSPFLHWLIVSLLLGLFYQSRAYKTILGLFAADAAVFVYLAMQRTHASDIPLQQLEVLGWLSISSATIYVAWMSYYYSRIVGLKSELEAEAERSRQTAKKLERARAVAEDFAKRRSRFFAKVNHDLRTPLNAIIGYAEVMLEDIEHDHGTDDPRHADVSRIRAAGNHLLSLVSRVLDPDSIQEDEDQLVVSMVLLGKVRDDVIAAIGPAIEQSGNRFVVNCPDPEYVLSTDMTKLRQIAINLLSNAGKFTRDGTVKLDLAVFQRDGRDQLKIAVSDTGIGVKCEALPRLFTEYEQASADTGTKYGGTGIGLALSRKLCRRLGGEIDVVSLPGRGSRFTAWLPTSLKPNNPEGAPREARMSSAGVPVGSVLPATGIFNQHLETP